MKASPLFNLCDCFWSTTDNKCMMLTWLFVRVGHALEDSTDPGVDISDPFSFPTTSPSSGVKKEQKPPTTLFGSWHSFQKGPSPDRDEKVRRGV